MNKAKFNRENVATIGGSSEYGVSRNLAKAININAAILKNVLDRLAELEEAETEKKKGGESMKKETAIDIFEDNFTVLYTHGHYTEKEECEALAMAIKALKQTEPHPVIYETTDYADGLPVYGYANCPACGYCYEEGDKNWGEPFCPHCGQALNWEILEEGDEE